jgi:hypothetical protein
MPLDVPPWARWSSARWRPHYRERCLRGDLRASRSTTAAAPYSAASSTRIVSVGRSRLSALPMLSALSRSMTAMCPPPPRDDSQTTTYMLSLTLGPILPDHSRPGGVPKGPVIVTRSGGRLNKLGMVRVEVRDGEQSTGIHG